MSLVELKQQSLLSFFHSGGKSKEPTQGFNLRIPQIAPSSFTGSIFNERLDTDAQICAKRLNLSKVNIKFNQPQRNINCIQFEHGDHTLFASASSNGNINVFHFDDCIDRSATR